MDQWDLSNISFYGFKLDFQYLTSVSSKLDSAPGISHETNTPKAELQTFVIYSNFRTISSFYSAGWALKNGETSKNRVFPRKSECPGLELKRFSKTTISIQIQRKFTTKTLNKINTAFM